MSSIHPRQRLTLAPGTEYRAADMWAKAPPGLREGNVLWWVSIVDIATDRFIEARCIHQSMVAHNWTSGGYLSSTDDVIAMTLAALKDPERTWTTNVVEPCVTDDCTNGGPLNERNGSKECHPCQARTVVACVECGCPDAAGYFWPVRQTLLAEQICHRCHHWAEQAAEPGIIVDGRHYRLGKGQPGRPGNSHSGFSGATFRIRRHDGTEILTHNLFTQGDIPEWFRDRLPDNAEFIRDEKRAIA